MFLPKIESTIDSIPINCLDDTEWVFLILADDTCYHIWFCTENNVKKS